MIFIFNILIYIDYLLTNKRLLINYLNIFCISDIPRIPSIPVPVPVPDSEISCFPNYLGNVKKGFISVRHAKIPLSVYLLSCHSIGFHFRDSLLAVTG